jgi:hypothetical protein
MKRLFMLMALCTLVVSACEPINSGGDDNTSTSALTITSKTEISVGSGSVMGNITYTLNNPVVGASVEAESDKEWVNSFDYSQMGKIAYKVDANPTYEDRIANINISYGDKVVETLRLKQAGKVRPEEIKVEAPYLLGHYYGDYAGYNYNYYLVLSESDYAANDEFNSAGYKYFLDIYSEERPADYNNIRVPNGVYTFNVNNDGQAGTFLESFSIYKEYDNSGMEIAERPYSEGVLTVTDDLVKLEIKFEDEENLYVVTYSGDYAMMDKRSAAGGIY